jgi:hypothetical protein
MTVEHKFVVGLDDLKAVIFACRHPACTARAVVSPEHSKVPEHCPGCGREWMPARLLAEIKTTQSTYVNFVEAIGKIRAHDAEAANGPKFRILLEFDEPK